MTCGKHLNIALIKSAYLKSPYLIKTKSPLAGHNVLTAESDCLWIPKRACPFLDVTSFRPILFCWVLQRPQLHSGMHALEIYWTPSALRMLHMTKQEQPWVRQRQRTNSKDNAVPGSHPCLKLGETRRYTTGGARHLLFHVFMTPSTAHILFPFLQSHHRCLPQHPKAKAWRRWAIYHNSIAQAEQRVAQAEQRNNFRGPERICLSHCSPKLASRIPAPS